MTASVLGGSAARQYAYTWSNGSSAQTLMGIPAERLIGTTLTVTAAGCYGQAHRAAHGSGLHGAGGLC